jgi:hypothetical protein
MRRVWPKTLSHRLALADEPLGQRGPSCWDSHVAVSGRDMPLGRCHGRAGTDGDSGSTPALRPWMRGSLIKL